MASSADMGLREIEKFGQLASRWWDPSGPMHTLHTINPLRMEFISRSLDLEGRSILDVGCGAGILSEALAKSGAHVTGIDLSAETLEIARQHAEANALEIDYRQASAEALAAEGPARFDGIVCMEVLEHVPEPGKVVAACSQLAKPGGRVFFSTIDRSLKSFLFAVIGGEYILGLLPRGSHTYRRLIRPQELKAWAGENGLELVAVSSFAYNPLTGKFKLVEKEDIDYMLHFVKR